MRKFRSLLLIVVTTLFSSASFGQRTEISILLGEQFFDAVIDAVFLHSQPPSFSIASLSGPPEGRLASDTLFRDASFSENSSSEGRRCGDSIRLLRETGGVRTAVRFREGKILSPLSFTGNYNPPLIGCVEFSGWAESSIDLRFDPSSQRLVANARVSNIHLNETRGVGGALIARMVQNSIDKRVNPIEIMQLDKISFMLPIQNSNAIRMKAVGVRHEIMDRVLLVHIAYEFEKAS